ncbi:hypothetical protein SAMN02745181_0322 [Rubritalea squalenifaciens DSM 18772]|uniref:Uncharacterized protein n=1 Tax=Rubritalea squalenifaciens DSM 18772 TaxID=1123071 RepID=A0A1M6BVM4_9BACT|nr:hypothetical protein [Rubritalea squalenifaciens]SHI52842.1 hypothetical protein SAMN02745181_0322 [Rubritalea squalenifaciens DSM 18772]
MLVLRLCIEGDFVVVGQVGMWWSMAVEFLQKYLLFFIHLGVVLAAGIFLWRWAWRDAEQRGKSPLMVSLAVVFLFPYGWAFWLAFRPGRVHADILRQQGKKRLR